MEFSGSENKRFQKVLEKRWIYKNFVDVKSLEIGNDVSRQVIWLKEIDHYYNMIAHFCSRRSDRLDIIKWLGDHGYRATWQAMNYAVTQGHVNTVEWLADNGAAMYTYHVDRAAANGHVEVMELLISRGCQYRRDSYYDHPKVIKWLRAKRQP